jgi:Rad3-related DNA helicase
MTHKTGKTFRIILRALEHASSGKPVVVVCSGDEEMKRVMKAAVKMAKTYLSPDFLTHAFADKYMMANGGTLTFLGNETYVAMDKECFKPNTHIIFDRDEDDFAEDGGE